MKKISFLSLFLLISVLFFADTVTDVSGEWELTVQTQRGDMTQSMNIQQDGESITVTMKGMRGGEFTGEGTIKGTAIEWTVQRSTQRGEFTMAYTGTVESNAMSGEAAVMNRTVEWSAVRKQ